MLLSAGFAALLLVVVALFYLAPRRQLCPGCGATRAGDEPLCASCGWIWDSADEDGDDEDDEGEAEVIDGGWRGEA